MQTASRSQGHGKTVGRVREALTSTRVRVQLQWLLQCFGQASKLRPDKAVGILLDTKARSLLCFDV